MSGKPGADVRSAVQLHVSDEGAEAEPASKGAGRQTKDNVVDKTNLKNTFVHVDQLFHGDDPDEVNLRKRARQFDQDRNGLLDLTELRELLVSELRARSQVRVLKIVVGVVILGLMLSIGAIAGLTFGIVASMKEVSVGKGNALMMSAHGGDPLRTAVASGSVSGTATTTNTTSGGRRRLLAAEDENSCMYNGTCPVSYTSCSQVSSWLDMLQQETREVDIVLDLSSADTAGMEGAGGANFIKARALKYVNSDAPWIHAVNRFPPDTTSPDEYKIRCASGALDRAAEGDCQCPVYLLGALLSNPSLAEDLLTQSDASTRRRLLGAAPATAAELPMGSHTLLPAVSLPCSSAQEILHHHHSAGHARMLLPSPISGHMMPISMRVASSAYTLDPSTGTNTSLLQLKLAVLPLGIPKLPDIYIGCPANHVPHHYGSLHHAAASAAAPAAASAAAPAAASAGDDSCTCHVYLRASSSDSGSEESGAVSLTPALLSAIVGASGSEAEGVLQGEGRRLLATECALGTGYALQTYANQAACEANTGANINGFDCKGKTDGCPNSCSCYNYPADGGTLKWTLMKSAGYYKSKDCFPAGAPVWLAGGSSKAVQDLVPGDMLAVANRDGSIGSAPFAFYGHKDAAAYTQYWKVVTEGGKELQLSGGHFLPASLTPTLASSRLITPSQLTLDHFVFVTDAALHMKADKVAWVSIERMQGLYAPHAASPDAMLIVGNGVVASEFTTALPLPVAKALRSFFLGVYSVIDFFGAKWAYTLIHDVAFHGFMGCPTAIRATLQTLWSVWGAVGGSMASAISI